jgi:hypothetical protein
MQLTTRWCRWAARPTLVFMLTIPCAVQSHAQDRLGSRNLPLGHWAYAYIGQLRSRGYLHNLNPLVQPYRRRDVAINLARLDPDTLPQPVQHWVGLLRDEFGPELERLGGSEPTVNWGIPVTGDVRGSSSRRTEPIHPAGDADVWGRYTAGVWAEAGPFAGEVRLKGDQQQEVDPDAPIDQGRAGRTDNGYLSLAVPFGDIWFGRFLQNWTVVEAPGLLVADYATAYTSLAFELRLGRFALRSFTGELEMLQSVTDGQERKRWISNHRLDYRSENLVLSIGETTLYATATGLQLRFLNPLEGTIIQSTTTKPGADEENVENYMVNAQIWVRWLGLEFTGEGLLDDIDIDASSGTRAPTRYAFYVRLRRPGLLRAIDAELSYRQVAAFTYRAARFVDNYTFLDRGIADNFVDYDRVTLAGTWHPPLAGLEVTPFFQFQRQGEGNLRDPFPVPYSDFVQSPSIFLGVVEKTYRFGLAGRFQPIRYAWLAWDVGANVVRNVGNQAGVKATDMEGIVGAGFSFDFTFPKR